MANRSNVRLLATARQTAFNQVAIAAMNEGTAREAVLQTVRAAYSKATADKVRLEYIVGRIAGSRLLPSNGTEAERIANARLIIAKAGEKGTATLKKGQSRRTNAEQRAYDSARVLWSNVLRDAGIKTVEARGGSKATGKRKAQAGKVAKKEAANVNRPASPKFKTLVALLEYTGTQVKAMKGTFTKTANLVPPELSSALQDFGAVVDKLIANRT